LAKLPLTMSEARQVNFLNISPPFVIKCSLRCLMAKNSRTSPRLNWEREFEGYFLKMAAKSAA
jgi:hypothetical protein